MKRYIVEESNSLCELQERCSERIEHGYLPMGGIAIHHEHIDENDIQGRTIFFQAMMTLISE